MLTPADLINKVLKLLSLSGQKGVSLKELWVEVSSHQGSVDDFQKQVIWAWLTSHDPIKIYIKLETENLTITKKYPELVELLSEERIFVFPSQETQWRYLTGTDDYKQIRNQLGEFPFQLLCVIALSGPKGIATPQLCRETGQDPRSSPGRLKKLEDMGFIIKKPYFDPVGKLHTSLSIHTMFLADSVGKKDDNLFEDLNFVGIKEYKQLIIMALKNAPNHVRSYPDLKKELNLSGSRLSTRLYGSVITSLVKKKLIEKVMVQVPGEEELQYCIKLTNEPLPSENDPSQENSEVMAHSERVDSGEGELPRFNKIFPMQAQIFQSVHSKKDKGFSSLDVCVELAGVRSYRPFRRILESYTAFSSDGRKLRALRNYSDPYPDQTIIKVSDFEGKYKFFRFFTREFSLVKDLPPIKEKKLDKERVSNIPTLKALQSKLSVKTPTPKLLSLSKLKKRPAEVEGSSREKRQKLAHEEHDEAEGKSHIISSELPIPRLKPKSLPHHRPAIKTETAPSLKAVKRWEALENILIELGGVTCASIGLCRKIDEALETDSKTDAKTLARDISQLIIDGKLETKSFTFVKGKRQITRKLLILVNPKYRPSEEEIEKAQADSVNDNQVYRAPEKPRTITSEVQFFSPDSIKKPQKRLSSLRETGRTEAGGTQGKKAGRQFRAVNKKYNFNDLNFEDTTIDDEAYQKDSDNELDPLTNAVSQKRRRKRKAPKQTSKHTPSVLSRFRSNSNFDKQSATTLFRLIVACKCLSKSSIDYDQLGKYFNNMPGREVLRKWVVIRKSLGGLAAVQKGCQAFELIVLRGIKRNLIKSEDLNNGAKGDLEVFLKLWDRADSSGVEAMDKTPLFATTSQNRQKYEFARVSEMELDLLEQIEAGTSVKQKELILSSNIFAYSEAAELQETDRDSIRTVIKSIVSTNKESFKAQQVKRILSEFDEKEVGQVTNELIDNKEISYFSLVDSDTKFILTDKFHNSVNPKVLSPAFFKSGELLKKTLCSFSRAKKGLILSHGVQAGEMACLMHLASKYLANFIRIGFTHKLENYESRFIDKEKLSCDIISTCNYHEIEQRSLRTHPIPTGKACSKIWIDSTGNVNTDLWIKIISTILYHITFRPGVSADVLQRKVSAVLSVNDFKTVMKWLEDVQCVKSRTPYSYWPTNEWYSVLGS